MLVAGALAGCTSTQTCVLWVGYETEQDAYDAATLVVIGTPEEVVGETSVYGASVPLHRMQVEQVLKGELTEPLDAARMIDSCGGDVPPDPLDTDRRIILMIDKYKGTWHALSPEDGVIDFPEGTELPFETD